MKYKEVTILIDFKIYLYLFEPIIEYLLAHNVNVYLCLPDDLIVETKKILKRHDNLKFLSLSTIKKGNKTRFSLHRVCSILFTRSDFSFQFKKKREQSTKKFTGLTSLLLNISKYTPKIPNNKINSFLSFISGFNLKNPFPTSLVMVGSLNASAELLGAKNLKVITVMESWDHAVKQPCGHKSDEFWGWNQDLCDDWERSQGCKISKVFHPLKLRYGHESFPKKRDITLHKKQGIKIMYPVASTKKFSIKILVDIETKIIEELIRATRELGWELFIKPRPNGLDGEFDFVKKFSHVTVGGVSHGDILNPADYYYSEEDNFKRFQPLEDIDFVFNAFTTFGLDAAVAQIPVLQLDLQQTIGFENSHMVYNNYHIKNYLINTSTLIRPINETLYTSLISNKRRIENIALSYTNELNCWLYKYTSSEEAITETLNQTFNLS